MADDASNVQGAANYYSTNYYSTNYYSTKPDDASNVQGAVGAAARCHCPRVLCTL